MSRKRLVLDAVTVRLRIPVPGREREESGRVTDKTIVYKDVFGQPVVKRWTPYGTTTKVTFDRDTEYLIPDYLDSLAEKHEPVGRQAAKRVIEQDLRRDKRKRDNIAASKN